MKRPLVKYSIYDLTDLFATALIEPKDNKKLMHEIAEELSFRKTFGAKILAQFVNTYFKNSK